MATKTKQWPDGSSATIQYDGQGDGEIIITSDPNNLYEARSMQLVVETTDGSGISRTVTINQAAKQRIDISNAVVTANNQTYSGSAKTPTPTVTLNGDTVPSTGYDVSYSNNTNAGTATITITGKGDYMGTAYGTFTINKAAPSYTAPSLRTGLIYSGSPLYLTTTGSTIDGTIYYSTNGVNWYTSRRTGTIAGDYDCYWKLVGDSNHTDISSTYLGTTTIAKASRTISFSSHPSTLYVGSSGTLSASVSAGGSDGTISFSSSNSSVASISGSTLTGVGSGSATIYATISEGTNYLSASTSYSQTINAVPSGFVNMGLPSGLLWAESNIGASTPYAYECQFFSWGNTDGHVTTSTYYFTPYSWGSSNNSEPYVSSNGAALTGNIPLSQDAARQNIGSPARMPTSSECQELLNNCKYINASGSTVTATDKRVTVNGIVGIYLESKINGNRLFLPCCGRGTGESLGGRTSTGCYWSSTWHSAEGGYGLFFNASGVAPNDPAYRYYGYAIRPVRE